MSSYKHLIDVINFSIDFNDDVKLLSGKLIEACMDVNRFNVVQWLVEHTNVDVNYSGTVAAKNVFNKDVTCYYTPLTAACDKDFVDAVKCLVNAVLVST